MTDSILRDAARAELIEALSEARQTYGRPGTRDVEVTAWNQRIDRALAALAADEAREPVAWLDPHEVAGLELIDSMLMTGAPEKTGRCTLAVYAHPPAPAAQAAPEQPAPVDTRKPCTCDGAGRGPGRACVVRAGGRLGELWRCAQGCDKPAPAEHGEHLAPTGTAQVGDGVAETRP